MKVIRGSIELQRCSQCYKKQTTKENLKTNWQIIKHPTESLTHIIFLPLSSSFFQFSSHSCLLKTSRSVPRISQLSLKETQSSSSISNEPTAVVALVLRLAPPRLAANLPSPEVLRDDGAVRMNGFSLKIPDNLSYLA